MELEARLGGVFPPCVTPFDPRQDVDYGALRHNIERYNETRVKGYMPLGTNGEFRSLTDEESLRILEIYAKHRAPGKTILAGAGRESTMATIAFVRKAADRGADFASLLPPHYFASAMTDDALIRYFTDVADASPIPVLLYNIPKHAAGLVFSPRLVAAVAGHPNIAGLKDTSKEDIGIYTAAVPDGAEFGVLAGTIDKFHAGLAAGAIGGVLSIADYLPEMCCDLQELFESGDREAAVRLDARIRDVSARAAGRHGVAGVKAAMDILGYRGGDPRLPLPALDGPARSALRGVLEAEGLLG